MIQNEAEKKKKTEVQNSKRYETSDAGSQYCCGVGRKERKKERKKEREKERKKDRKIERKTERQTERQRKKDIRQQSRIHGYRSRVRVNRGHI